MSAFVVFVVFAATVIAALLLPMFIASVVAAFALTGVAVHALHELDEAMIQRSES